MPRMRKQGLIMLQTLPTGEQLVKPGKELSETESRP
eukprot:COSAG06_NODE_48059_length_335_cov_0.355932_1_plen_35_part_10